MGQSRQAVDQAGRAALKPTYRGAMIRPDATVEGRPLWLKSRFESTAVDQHNYPIFKENELIIPLELWESINNQIRLEDK